MTFGAARRCFNGVIVVGYLRKGADAELRLNPDDRDILEEGDRIIALANSGGRSHLKPSLLAAFA